MTVFFEIIFRSVREKISGLGYLEDTENIAGAMD